MAIEAKSAWFLAEKLGEGRKNPEIETFDQEISRNRRTLAHDGSSCYQLMAPGNEISSWDQRILSIHEISPRCTSSWSCGPRRLSPRSVDPSGLIPGSFGPRSFGPVDLVQEDLAHAYLAQEDLAPEDFSEMPHPTHPKFCTFLWQNTFGKRTSESQTLQLYRVFFWFFSKLDWKH